MVNNRQLAKNTWYDWSINHILKSMEKPSRHTTSFNVYKTLKRRCVSTGK